MILVLLWLAVAMAQAAELPVWTDENSTANNLGGAYGTYGSACDVATELSPAGLQIRYSNHAAGPCGMFLHLFDDRLPPGKRTFIDTAKFPFLNFEIKGSLNAEVRLADPERFAKDDSISVGTLKDFARGADISVPTERARLRGSRAAQLVLAFPQGSEGTLLISRIVFSTSPTMEQVQAIQAIPQSARAMWFWEFGDCLTNTELCAKAFSFAKANHVSTIFAQIAYACESTCALTQPDRLREIIRLASAQGLRIQALDGAAEYSLTAYHPQMMSVVLSVIEFNRASPPDARFAGIHFDIEPYLLLGFSGSAREKILRQYLALNRKVMDSMTALGPSRIELGADIPFWYDEAGETAANPYVIDFEGKTQDVSRHLIDMLDNVVLMDYRNSALGQDGIATLGKGEVDYGSSHSKKVWIGVETIPQRPSTVVFLVGLSEQRWEEMQDHPLMYQHLFKGYGLRTVSAGGTRYVGLAPRDKIDPAFLAALEQLAQELELKPAARPDLKLARSAFGRGYRDFNPIDLPEREAFSVTSLPVTKISFAGSTRSQMDRVLSTVENQFTNETGFGGIAIHAFASWSEMPQ